MKYRKVSKHWEDQMLSAFYFELARNGRRSWILRSVRDYFRHMWNNCNWNYQIKGTGLGLGDCL